MAHPSVTIDLGELPRDQPPLVDGQWPGWVRLRHRFGRSPWRLVAAAAVAVTTGLGLTAAAAPPPRPLALLFQVPGDGVTTDGGRLYTVEHRGGPASDRTLTAYQLTDGAVVWRTRHPGLNGSSWVYPHGELLLLLTLDPGTEDDPREHQITRLDPDTGESMWTVEGNPLPAVGDRLLLRSRLAPPEDPSAIRPETPVRHRYAAIDPDTGEPAWQRDIESWRTGVVSEPGRLLQLDDSGTLTAYDLATGTRAGSVESVVPGAGRPAHLELALHQPSSLALIEYVHNGESVLRAYDVGSLRLRWSRSYPLGDAAGGGQLRVSSCQHLICVRAPATGVPEALDPADGTQVWSIDWLTDPATAQFVVHDHHSLPDHLSVADWSGSTLATQLVAASTGALALEPGWSVGQSPPTGPGAPVPVLSRPESRVADITEVTDTAGIWGDTWVGTTRLDRPGVRVLGTIDRRYGRCRAHGWQVICQPESVGEISVWRVRG